MTQQDQMNNLQQQQAMLQQQMQPQPMMGGMPPMMGGMPPMMGGMPPMMGGMPPMMGMQQPMMPPMPQPQQATGATVILVPLKIQMNGGSLRFYQQYEVPAGVHPMIFLQQLAMSGIPIDIYVPKPFNGGGGGGWNRGGGGGGYNNGGGGRW